MNETLPYNPAQPEPGEWHTPAAQIQSEQLNELADALAKAQGAIKGASKDTTNPHFKSKYADLASVWDACREPLSKNGLAVIQTGATVNNQYIMRTRLMHSSGQWIEGEVPCMIARQTNPMQALGSAITYARRYGLAAIVGIAPEDDDGNASGAVPDKVWAREEDVQAWKGPLGKTALKKQLRALSSDLESCTEFNMLPPLEHSYKAVLDQADVDLPEWAAPARDAIDKKRNELADAEADELGQTLLDAG